jgi:hypothetical protein
LSSAGSTLRTTGHPQRALWSRSTRTQNGLSRPSFAPSTNLRACVCTDPSPRTNTATRLATAANREHGIGRCFRSQRCWDPPPLRQMVCQTRESRGVENRLSKHRRSRTVATLLGNAEQALLRCSDVVSPAPCALRDAGVSASGTCVAQQNLSRWARRALAWFCRLRPVMATAPTARRGLGSRV